MNGRKGISITILTALFLLLSNIWCLGQDALDINQVNHLTLTKEIKKRVIDWISEKMGENYIIPETAEK